MNKNQGKCGKCNSFNLNYGKIEIEGSQVYYPYNCIDCKAEGKEWYLLKYIETLGD